MIHALFLNPIMANFGEVNEYIINFAMEVIK